VVYPEPPDPRGPDAAKAAAAAAEAAQDGWVVYSGVGKPKVVKGARAFGRQAGSSEL